MRLVISLAIATEVMNHELLVTHEMRVGGGNTNTARREVISHSYSGSNPHATDRQMMVGLS